MNPFFVEQASMYLAYHRNPKNRATHFVGVPLIAFSLLIPMSWLDLFTIGGQTVTLAAVFLLAVGVLYLWMEPLIGFCTLAFFVPGLFLADAIAATGYGAGGATFAALFVGRWLIQLIGHAFEGRKPALADNLFQVFIAPMFLMAEVFFALGRKRDLHDEMESRWVKYAAVTPAGKAA